MPKPRRRAFAMPPRLVEHELAFESIDERHDGFRIAHLTDVHCGRITPESHVRHAVELANAAKPDVIIMTGDYVNWDRREVPIMKEQLAGLLAPHVIVTLGNHDYFTSGRHVADAMRDNGYTVLKNEHITIQHRGAPVHIVGIDDPVTRRHDIDRAFSTVPEGGTRLVACHCPERIEEVAQKGAHLMLSGHTHGGQINVRGITDRIFRRAGRRYYNAGFYNVDDTVMYLSAGVGFSGVRVRAGKGTRSEVSVFTLRALPRAA